MTREQYGQAINKIERKLGLDNQAHAVVFHVKNGREHCHVVWSRIDTEKMQARHMEFDRQKLREVARELVRDFDHEMPKHLGEDRGTDRHKGKFNEVTLAEQGQAERSEISPADRRKAVTESYELSDSADAFRHALQERGYTLSVYHIVFSYLKPLFYLLFSMINKFGMCGNYPSHVRTLSQKLCGNYPSASIACG